MTKAEARQLAREIGWKENCRVTGFRRYARGSWGINVLDTVAGYSFVVAREEDWWARVADKADAPAWPKL